MGRELYLILGISESAGESEVDRAYRKLARRYHPDINPGDRSAAELYRRISEAYDVLSDPEKRGFYDQHGYSPDEGDAGAAAPLDPGHLSPRFREIFDNLFGDRRGVPGPGRGRAAGSGEAVGSEVRGGEPGHDIEACVSLTFEEAMRGLTTQVEATRRRRCDDCRGAGAGYDNGLLRKCPTCGGRGTISRRERVRVDIPPGVSSGSRLRFPARGHARPGTGDRGDLFVVTNVSPHPFFRRVGDNLYCSVPVTVPEAALGGKVAIPTLDGTVMLRIPPGVQPGRVLRLRGRGAPSLRGEGVRGDQYVEIRVVVPRVIDERSRELLRELERLHPEDPRKDLEIHAL